MFQTTNQTYMIYGICHMQSATLIYLPLHHRPELIPFPLLLVAPARPPVPRSPNAIIRSTVN